MIGHVAIAPPPKGRPPGPADGSRPPGTTPQPSGEPGICAPPSPGITAESYWSTVREVIKREWIRLAKGGADALKYAWVLTSDAQAQLDELVEAMQEAKNVAGLVVDADSGKCVQYWENLACFSRWYAKLEASLRQHVIESIKTDPNFFAGIYTSEYEELPPPPADCEPDMKEAERDYCCPAEVRADKYYSALAATGKQPTPQEPAKGLGVAGWTAIGVAAAALLGIAYLATSSEPSTTARMSPAR